MLDRRNFIVIPKRQNISRPIVAPASAGDAADYRGELLEQAREGYAEGILDRLDRKHSIHIRNSPRSFVAPASEDAAAEGNVVGVNLYPAVNAIAISGSPDLERTLRQDVDVAAVINSDRKTIQAPDIETVAKAPEPDPWHLKLSGASSAHALGLKGKDWWIGLLDTGIDASHPEFAGRQIEFAEIDKKGNVVPGAAARDSSPVGHGTHVAGLAAGASCGIAPEANLAVALAVTRTSTVQQIIGAMEWLATFKRPDGKTGADVINLSFVSVDNQGRAITSKEFRSITRRLLTYFNIPVFGAIGNSGPGTHGSPGNYRSVVGIGAVDRANKEWPQSSWTTIVKRQRRYKKPDFLAEGVDLWSSVPGGTYKQMSGTSMASPIAAGVSLLLMQQVKRWATIKSLLRGRSVRIHVGPGDRHCHKIRW